jgi:hypothetical protein
LFFLNKNILKINCIENVHRLLKSQTNSKNDTTTEEDNISIKSYQKEVKIEENNLSSSSLPISLTRELLKLHDQKWEEECQNNWRKRLNLNSLFLKRKEEENLKNKGNLTEVNKKKVFFIIF